MENYISYKEILNCFDINKGDVVFVGSDMTHLAMEAARHGERMDLNAFIDSFINQIGPQGTLLFPTFHWGFCSGETFDYANTPSLTGALTVAALKRNDFVRTKHPIYSFAVWGKDQDFLYNLENKSSFGEDSPFAYLHRNHAKMLIIGLDYQHSFTFVHYVEEQERVNYRYMKNFTGKYIDKQGLANMRTYSMYVRDLTKGVVTQVNPMGEILERSGIATYNTINHVPFRLIYLTKAYQAIVDDIRRNQAKNLFQFAGERGK